MTYPIFPTPQNGFQILGQALSQGGAQVQEYAAGQDKMKLAMEEMAARRAAGVLAKIKEEREARAAEELAKRQAAEETRKAAEFATKQEQEKKAAAAQAQVAAGKTIPGKAAGGVIGPDETVPYSFEEANRLLLGAGALPAKDFVETLNPTKTIEGQKEILGVKTEAANKLAEARMKYQAGLEEYRQGRIDARTMMTLRAAMDRAEMSEKSKPKTDSGMPVQPLGDTELKTLKDIQNTAYSIGKIRIAADNISNLKRGPIAGRVAGKNPYDVDLQALERLVKQTVPGMARGVFGEVGVLTDSDVERYSQMLASVKDDPALAKKILDDLEDKIANAYRNTRDTYEQGGRDVSGFAAGLDFKALSQGKTKPTSRVAKGSDNDPLGLGL
jgi:hypothetical protein